MQPSVRLVFRAAMSTASDMSEVFMWSAIAQPVMALVWQSITVVR
ncbi:hypothetical protein C9F11_43835 (plasmid) [Streptomyces sp. YIM 121038]|nr:hypothetical protein C9F11_43835 [Streptomyces sp. YIM 121038]